MDTIIIDGYKGLRKMDDLEKVILDKLTEEKIPLNDFILKIEGYSVKQVYATLNLMELKKQVMSHPIVQGIDGKLWGHPFNTVWSKVQSIEEMTLWIRKGDGGDYEDTSIDEVKDFLKTVGLTKENSRRSEYGISGPGFEYYNYISLFYGDEEVNAIRDLTESEYNNLFA